MSLLSAVLAQLVHVVLMLAAAPTVAGFQTCVEAALAGGRRTPLLQPWRDLRRLARKERLVVDNATVVSAGAPLVGFAAIFATVCLVPSFTLGMALAPMADLLTIAGLIALARSTRALALLDHGTAPGGIAAARAMRLGLSSDTALLLGLFALAAFGGTSNLDELAGLQREGLLVPAAASALAASALLLVAAAQPAVPGPAAIPAEATGLDSLTAALETLFWLNLIATMFLPLGIGQTGRDAWIRVAGTWAVGLLVWIAKLLVLAAGLAVCRCVTASHRPRAAAESLALAVLLALLAAVFALFATAAA